jgi:hypothetical protein
MIGEGLIFASYFDVNWRPDPEHANRAVAELSTQETVATSAIEGVKLDPHSVRSSLMRRLGLGVAKDREERIGLAVKGVIDMLADSTQNPGPLTLERLFVWHTYSSFDHTARF